MTANSSINLVGLDFDSIKSNLKSYLRAQSQFADYDFDGSNLSVLLDILAYNTHYQAFYLNMIASESFLDSAQLRDSVVSHAKELNYVPRSARSAQASVSLRFNANTDVVTIPRGTSFTTSVGYVLYTFITDEESIYFSSNNTFQVDDLPIYEGQLNDDQFIVNYEDPTQRFILTDPAIDTRSILVTVVEDNTGTIDSYTPASTTLGLGADDKIYFLQASSGGKYEIVFGDGILGRRPKDNALVQVSYRTCSGSDPNGASSFQLDTAFADFTATPAITVEDIARGGDEPESISSIKFYAPRHFQTQERAVNTNDYEIILSQRFPEINAISAYGGETLNPPQFGKVYISVDIAGVEGLPDTKVAEYQNFIKPRSPLSIDTVFVSPDFLYYSVDTTVNYNVNETNYSLEQIRSLVTNAIVTYNDTYLNDFKSLFWYSKFIHQIDNIDNAGILSNDTDINIYKKFIPTYNEPFSLDIDFKVPFTEEGAALGNTHDVNDLVAVRSSAFTSGGERVQIQDDGNGVLRLVKTSGTSQVVTKPGIGSVDYSAGKIKLDNLTVDGLDVGEQYIRIYAVPASKDFSTKENVILALESDQINIEVIGVREGTSSAQTRQRA